MLHRLPSLSRRSLLALCATPGIAPATAHAAARMQFPQDQGAHPAFQIEWWYLTGWAGPDSAHAHWGFQVTFFRTRVPQTQSMRSALAARQLVFAHAALTDLGAGRYWHDQALARWSGLPPGEQASDRAACARDHTLVTLNDWRLERQGTRLHAQVHTAQFTLDLQAQTTQPVLLQGDQGHSRKGPDRQQASYYYSEPQLALQGTLQLQGRSIALGGAARGWLDHEWSDGLLHPQAVGWDWIGINFFDGSALTAFQLRTANGSALWSGGSWRAPAGSTQPFAPGTVAFSPLRHWHSAASGARYPVENKVRTPVGSYSVHALLDDQELDSRASTGAIYWEGLCALHDAQGRAVGRGYLELTGYAQALRL